MSRPVEWAPPRLAWQPAVHKWSGTTPRNCGTRRIRPAPLAPCLPPPTDWPCQRRARKKKESVSEEMCGIRYGLLVLPAMYASKLWCQEQSSISGRTDCYANFRLIYPPSLALTFSLSTPPAFRADTIHLSTTLLPLLFSSFLHFCFASVTIPTLQS